MKFKNNLVPATLFILAFPTLSWAQKIQFNPDAPLYIEYKSAEKQTATDLSLQIEDTTGPAKMRLSLQAKPQAMATYYGYIWLQLGKKITKEVIFKRGNYLSGWLTDQDGIQALFLFDNEREMTEFKNKAFQSKKPLTDKNSLPQLVNTPPTSAPAATSKSIEIAAEMGEVSKFGRLMDAYAAFTPAQKKANDAKANQLALSALKQYQLKNFSAAEAQFDESLHLNPTVGINRYYLGICYYQTKKYDRSLALLSLAEGAEYNYAEYKYYLGLDNLKLKNYSKAVENLEDARDENDPDYSGAAAFFSGHVYFQKEDYSQARINFEYTLDQSKDPKMDREAETMLEKIDMIEGFSGQSKDKFKYTLFIGFGYDSNVINISTENLATDLSAYRAMYGASLNYKILYNFKHDISVDFAASDYYSLNSKFKSDSTVQAADPQQISVGLPYHRRFQLGKTLFTWGFLPSYQILNMSLVDSQRKKILDSTILGTDLNWALSEKHFSKVFLEYSKDKSALEVTSAENNSSATKMTLSTSQTFVTGPSVKESWIGDLAYAINSAEGDNNDYSKLSLGVTYSRLGIWSALNSARIDFTSSKYEHAQIDRSDMIATLTLGVTKEINRKLNLTLNGLYTTSQSTNNTYKYNKFTAQSMLTYNGAF